MNKSKEETIRLSSYLRLKLKEHDFNQILKYCAISGVVLPLPFFAMAEKVTFMPPHPSILISVMFVFLYKFYDKKQKELLAEVNGKFSSTIDEYDDKIQRDVLSEYFDKLTPKKKPLYKAASLLFNIPRLFRKKGKHNLIENSLHALAIRYIELETKKPL